jgi:hypothetical protein
MLAYVVLAWLIFSHARAKTTSSTFRGVHRLNLCQCRIITAEQDLIEHQQEMQVQKGHLAEAEAEAAIAAHKEQRRQAEDEYKHCILKELAEAEEKSASYATSFSKPRRITVCRH